MGRAVHLNKGRFLASFLLGFAVLLSAWEWTHAARWYIDAMLACAGLLGLAVHGWVLETNLPAQAGPVWAHGSAQVRAALHFDALAVGIVPVLALLLATPGIGAARRLILMLSGALACFGVDVLLLAAFPLLVYHQNPFTDVLGTFLGLVAFVGAPVIIWFALTFSHLRAFLPGLHCPPHPPPASS